MSNIIEVYKSLRNLIQLKSKNSLEGELVLTKDNIELIKSGVTHCIVSSDIIVDGRTQNSNNLIESTNNATITLIPKTPPGLNQYYISDSSENFFYQFNVYYKIPTNLYVHEIYSEKGFDEVFFIKKLNFSIKVKNIIDTIADYKTKDDVIYEYFLYALNPLIIKPIFNEYDFDVKLNEADEILSFINTDLKKNLYISFLKLEIINLLSGIEEKKKFYCLLSNFKTVYLNFKNSIDLYFSEFDIQKNKIEIQSAKIELLKKIHSTVNELSGKLITIPAAYFLLLKELKFTQIISLPNTICLFAAIMYSIVIQSSISNQFIFLKTLKKDINDFINHKLKGNELVEDYKKYETELNTSYSVQSFLLWLFGIILWFIPILMIVILIYKNCKQIH